MNKINYQKELDKITGQIGENLPEEQKPHLFLHACCAPCSSYVLEYLTRYCHITLFFYNPNITPETEYQKRMHELQRFIREAGYEERGQVVLMEGSYDPGCFFEMAKGMEDLPERENAATTAMNSGCGRPPKKPPNFTPTISPPPSPSVPIKTPSGSTKSGSVWPKNMAYAICLLISRKRAGISVPSPCRKNIIFTGRTIADVYFPKRLRKQCSAIISPAPLFSTMSL